MTMKTDIQTRIQYAALEAQVKELDVAIAWAMATREKLVARLKGVDPDDLEGNTGTIDPEERARRRDANALRVAELTKEYEAAGMDTAQAATLAKAMVKDERSKARAKARREKKQELRKAVRKAIASGEGAILATPTPESQEDDIDTSGTPKAAPPKVAVRKTSKSKS